MTHEELVARARADGITSEILSPEEGARETREKLDHTLSAYARLEKRSAEKGREIARLRTALRQWAARIAAEALEPR